MKVGLLVILGAVALFVFFSFLGGSTAGRGADEYYAVFDDASGLAPKSQVRVAGIPVGEITKIELTEGKARVWFRLRRDIRLYPNAAITKRSESLLGDYLLDLDPGSPEAGPPIQPGASTSGSVDRPGGIFPVDVQPLAGQSPDRPLPPGSQVPHVKENVQMEQLMESMARITADVETITHSLRESVAGDQQSLQRIVRNMQLLSENLNKELEVSSSHVNQILNNAEAVSRDVRSMTGGPEVKEIVSNLREITQHTREVVATVQGIVGTNEGDLRTSVGSVKDSLASLNRSLARVETVTERVEHGDGLLGKLTSDQQFAQKVGGAVTDAADYVGRLTRIQTEIMLRSELLVNERSTKNYLKLRLIPKPDKYFELDVVDDPRGLLQRETVVRSPPSSTEVASQEVRTTYYNRLKFGAQFAKRYSFLTLRFGLIESTGGLGFDMHFLEDHLELSVDAFEFANPAKDYPRIKAWLNFLFLRHLFITAGGDDIINPPEIEPTTGRILTGRDWFVGGGFYFTDDDIKALLPVLPNISL